jgi:hypothetical protein
METCKNCGVEVSGKYCSNCGQEIITVRLSVKHIIKDVTHGMFHWESSIFNTCKELIIHPGKVIHSYIDGKRKSYIKPFTYFIFIQTIYVLIFHWLSGNYFAFMTATMQVSGEMTNSQQEKLHVIQHEIQHLINANINYLNFIMPLIFALYIKIFLKKKTGINYAESVVFGLYVIGTTLLFSMVFMLLSWINPAVWNLRMVASQVFMIYAFVQYSGYPLFKGIVRGFFASFLSYLTYVFIVIVISFIYLMFFSDIKL